jgi:hypothetical protein
MGKKKDKIKNNDTGKNGEENQKELDDILGKIKETKSLDKEVPEEKETDTIPSPVVTEELESKTDSIEEILEKISEKEDEAFEEMNLAQRFIAVFTKPTELFNYLRVKPEYWAPFLIAIVLSIITTYLTYDLQVDATIERIENSERFSDEQKDIYLDGIEEGRYGARRYLSTFVFAPLGLAVLYLVASALFLFVGNIVLGGKAKYVQVLSVFSYTFLILMITGLVLKLPFMLINQSIDFNTSLSLFLPAAAKDTSIYRLFSAFDIFTLWFLAVFAIGFSIIYRFSQLKSFLSVFITWFIWVILYKVVLGSFFSAFTG